MVREALACPAEQLSDRNEILFMLAPKWADDVRTIDRAQYHRGTWHYINWPFKPDTEPESVRTRPLEPVNILTALAENERIVRSAVEAEKRAELSHGYFISSETCLLSAKTDCGSRE